MSSEFWNEKNCTHQVWEKPLIKGAAKYEVSTRRTRQGESETTDPTTRPGGHWTRLARASEVPASSGKALLKCLSVSSFMK